MTFRRRLADAVRFSFAAVWLLVMAFGVAIFVLYALVAEWIGGGIEDAPDEQ